MSAPSTRSHPGSSDHDATQRSGSTERPGSTRSSRAERLYDALLRLYPQRFRDRFADSMHFAFATDAAHARRAGLPAYCAFLLRSVLHIVAFAPLERLGGAFSNPSWRSGPGSDLRHAARRLRRSPGFAIAAVVSLGLGIGANTAIFSLVHGVVLEPLPYPRAERLVALQHSADGAGLPIMGLSLGTWVHYREGNETLEEIAVYTPTAFALLGEAGAQRVPGVRVSQGFFEIFLDGAPPLGRTIGDADQQPGAPLVAMISDDLWRSRFGADRAIVGRAISVDGRAVEIAGVLPAEFDVPSATTQIWLPEQIDADDVILGGFGRPAAGLLKPGVTARQAQADLRRLIPSLAERFNPVAFGLLVTGGRLASVVTPLKEHLIGDVERILWILLGTVGFVLAVACANVANLFLVRAESQRQEIAVRAALGAGRGQIIRHHLSESLLLGLAGGAAGVLLAVVAVRWVTAWGPSTIPRLHEVGIHTPILAFALAISIGAGLAFGAIPLVRWRSGEGVGSVTAGGRGTTAGRARHRARNALVVAQVALALVLLIGAGLMVRSFWHLRTVDPGFEPDNALVLQLGLPEALYPDPADAFSFQQRIIERLSTLPGVSVVGATRCLPLAGCNGSTPVYPEGLAFDPNETPPSVDVRGATSGYFAALGIPVIEGRAFEPADPFREPAAAVVSRNLAQRLWPGESAVGKRIYPDVPEEEPYTVVGVVGDHFSDLFGEAAREYLYVSFLGPYAYVAPPHSLTFVLRTEVPPLSLAAGAREAVRALDSNVPIADLRTLRQVFDQASAPTAFAMILLVTAGIVALVLGAVGVYGVLSYIVAQRTGEIGVRLALGARATDVARLILAQGLSVAGLGLVLGMTGALLLSRLMGAVLFGVEPIDPPTYLAVGIALALIASLATWLPARRAARVDPMIALRSDSA